MTTNAVKPLAQSAVERVSIGKSLNQQEQEALAAEVSRLTQENARLRDGVAQAINDLIDAGETIHGEFCGQKHNALCLQNDKKVEALRQFLAAHETETK